MGGEYYEGELRRTVRGNKYRAIGNVVIAKQCTKCSRMKSVDEFQRRVRMVGGVSSQCRECTAEYMRDYYRKNPENFTSGTRKYEAGLIEFTNEHRAELIKAVQASAKRSGRNPLFNAGYIEGLSEALDIIGIRVRGVNEQ